MPLLAKTYTLCPNPNNFQRINQQRQKSIADIRLKSMIVLSNKKTHKIPAIKAGEEMPSVAFDDINLSTTYLNVKRILPMNHTKILMLEIKPVFWETYK
jgi:hypothetical protein